MDKLDISEYRISKFSIIYQFDQNFNKINTFNTAKEAADNLNVSINFINESISKQLPVKSYFFTKDPNKIYDIIKSYYDRSNKLSDNCVSIYNTETNKIIKTFRSIKDCAKHLNVKFKDVKYAINNKIAINDYLISYGFNEIYSEQVNSGIKINQYDLEGNFIKQYKTISECAKDHPKVRLVLSGLRSQTHNSVFKFADKLKI